jgi:hypothetical protein
MVEKTLTFDERRSLFSQEKVLPHAYSFINVGAPDCRFDPSDETFIQEVTGAHSKLLVAASRLITCRLTDLGNLPYRIPFADFVDRLAEYEDQLFKLSNGIKHYFSGEIPIGTHLFSEGLAEEVLFRELNRSLGVPMQVSTFSQDRRGIDFILALKNVDIQFDISSSGHEQWTQRKLDCRKESVLFIVPTRTGNLITNGHFTADFAELVHELVGESADPAITLEQISSGDVWAAGAPYFTPETAYKSLKKLVRLNNDVISYLAAEGKISSEVTEHSLDGLATYERALDQYVRKAAAA